MGHILDLVPILGHCISVFNRMASNTNLIEILTLYTSIAATDKPFQGIKIHF